MEAENKEGLQQYAQRLSPLQIIRLFCGMSPNPQPGYVRRVKQERGPRHATKKGPGRSLGKSPMSREKKDNPALRVKRPKNIPSGYADFIGVNGIRGSAGCGR
ncbi:MAG: hypothetical protein PSX71_08735 [bacterium]|nr:hypothetical protein [bacterium]